MASISRAFLNKSVHQYSHQLSIKCLSICPPTNTGRNRTFPYFWNVAETYSSMVPSYLHLAETWKFKSAWFRHVSGTEMSSHVSVIFKPADFRCCSVCLYVHLSGSDQVERYCKMAWKINKILLNCWQLFSSLLIPLNHFSIFSLGKEKDLEEYSGLCSVNIVLAKFTWLWYFGDFKLEVQLAYIAFSKTYRIHFFSI